MRHEALTISFHLVVLIGNTELLFAAQGLLRRLVGAPGNEFGKGHESCTGKLKMSHEFFTLSFICFYISSAMSSKVD